MRRAARRALLVLASLVGAGCPAADEATTGGRVLGGSVEGPVAPSTSVPRDSAQPVTAITGPQGMLFDSSGRLVSTDPGPPPPTAMRSDRPLQAEPPAHEDQAGVTLEIEFKPRALGVAPKVPEAVPASISKVHKIVGLTNTIDLFAAGRMRWLVTSRAMPFPFHTELRAKYDRWGHVALWPNLLKYRVLPVGSLRVALDEGRVDVMPVATGTATKGAPGKRLGEATRAVTIESALGKVHLEMAPVPEAALGGPLFCRALVEMIGVDPATPECKREEVVLSARFDFVTGVGLDVEVTSLLRRNDMAPADASCPPGGATFEATGLPDAPEGVFLTPAELESMRSKPDPKAEPEPNAPAEGIILDNALDRRVYFMLDGVNLALLPARSTRYILGMPRGRYTGEWRTFLGEIIEAPHPIVLPGRFSSAATRTPADAGPP